MPALKAESFSCSFPKVRHAQTRNTEAIKHTSSPGPGVAERYLPMGAERASFPMGMMARLLGVSRSGFHGWVGRRRDDPWEAAREAVRACRGASCGRFGARSVRAALAAQGMRPALYRVRGPVREPGMRGVCFVNRF